MHLDFGDFPQSNGTVLKNGVRINDATICATNVNGVSTPCTFPRDRPFTLSVNLQIGGSSPTGNISLVGAGGLASGSQSVTLTPASLANQFGEVKFYMGFPWNGSFDTTDILVTRQ